VGFASFAYASLAGTAAQTRKLYFPERSLSTVSRKAGKKGLKIPGGNVQIP
jgi:hypothetical protein